MTRDETIKALRDALDSVDITFPYRLTLVEAIEHLSIPDPQGLDEAAEDSWALYEYRESPKGLYSTCYVDGFKAGAKWMAGQFEEEAYEEEVQELYQDEDGVHCVVSVGVDYNPGDKVIVQIRKA